IRHVEIEAAVADDLDHLVVWARELCAQRHAARRAEPAATDAHHGAGFWTGNLRNDSGRVAGRLREHDVVCVDALAQLGQEIVRVDGAGLARVGGELGGALRAARPLARDLLDARGSGRAERARRFLAHYIQELPQNARAVALQPQLTRKTPHWGAGLDDVDVDLFP